MIEIVLSAGILGLVMTIMAVGVIMGRAPIKGSCGGMSALGMKGACDICGGDVSRCDSKTAGQEQGEAIDLAYDADSKETTNKY